MWSFLPITRTDRTWRPRLVPWLLFGVSACRSNAAEKSTDAPDATSVRSAQPDPVPAASPASVRDDSSADEKHDRELIDAIERRLRGSTGATPGKGIEPSGPTRRPIEVTRDGKVLVDIEAKVSPELLERIRELGGSVVSNVPRFDAVRATVPVDSLRALARRPEVRSIRSAAASMTNSASDSATPR